MDVSFLLHANGNLHELGHESTLGYYVRKCRVCLRNGHTPIFNEYNPKLEALRMFADIQIEDDDAYPKFLCNDCDELLQGCITLRRTAQDTERKLKTCIHSDSIKIHINQWDDTHNILEKLDTTEAIDMLNQSLNIVRNADVKMNKEENYVDMLEIMSTAIVNTGKDHISQLYDESSDEIDDKEEKVETPDNNEYVVMLVGEEQEAESILNDENIVYKRRYPSSTEEDISEGEAQSTVRPRRSKRLKQLTIKEESREESMSESISSISSNNDDYEDNVVIVLEEQASIASNELENEDSVPNKSSSLDKSNRSMALNPSAVMERCRHYIQCEICRQHDHRNVDSRSAELSVTDNVKVWSCKVCNLKFQYKKDVLDHFNTQKKISKEIDVLLKTNRSALVDDTFLEQCTESIDHNDTQPEYNNMLCFDNVEHEVIIGDEEELVNKLEITESKANLQISILRALGLLDDNDMSTTEDTEIVIDEDLLQEMYPDTDISRIFAPYVPADSDDTVVLHEDHLLTESVDEETIPRDNLSYSEIEELLSREDPIESLLQHLADDRLAVPSKPIDPDTKTLSSYLIYKNAKTYDERQILFTPLQTVDHDYVATNIVVDTEDRFFFANVKLPIQCDDCPESFSDWVPYVVHSLVWQHYGSCSKCNKPSVCGAKLCNKELINMKYAIKRDHIGKAPVICETCGAKVRKDNLKTHNRGHETDLPYKCELCPYRSRHLGSLRLHFRTHTGEKPFACDQCDVRCRSSSNLLVHKRAKHGEKRFECECGRKFGSTGMLRSHRKKDHAEVKRFPCRLCGEVFDTSNKWSVHKNEVHRFEKMPMGRTPLYKDDKFKKQPKTIQCELGMYTT